MTEAMGAFGACATTVLASAGPRSTSPSLAHRHLSQAEVRKAKQQWASSSRPVERLPSLPAMIASSCTCTRGPSKTHIEFTSSSHQVQSEVTSRAISRRVTYNRRVSLLVELKLCVTISSGMALDVSRILSQSSRAA